MGDRATGRNGDQPLQTETAYAWIKRDIISCALPPGQQVTEEYLADRFGTGRGAVRAALKRLYQEHLVQTISRQRYVIPSITLREARELFDIRSLLEPVAARRAAGVIEPHVLARLRELCESQYAVGDQRSAIEFLSANTEFHLIVARAGGSLVLADLISGLLDRVERFHHVSHALMDRNVAAHDEHVALVDALEAGDGYRAERVMAAQIDSSWRFVLEALTQSPSIQTTSVTLPARRVAGNGAARGGE